MNKLFTKIAALCLGATMAVGVGVAVASNSKEASPVHAADPTVTYTATSTSAVSTSGTAVAGSSATLSSTGSWNSGGVQMTNGKNMSLTITGYAGYTITGLSVSVRSNSSKGTGSLTFTIGGTTKASIAESAFNSANWHGSWSTTYVNVTPTLTSTTVGTGQNMVLTIACKSGSSNYNSLYFSSVTLTYKSAKTELTGITLGGAASQNAMTIGSSDLTAKTVSVTLNPTNATDQKVNIVHQSGTSGLFTVSSSATCTSGSGSFTVTGKGNTSGSETFRIKGNTETSVYVDLVVTALDDSVTYWTVSFDSDGGASVADMSVEDGEKFEFPSPGTKEHYSFDGWSSDGGNTLYDAGDESPAVDDDIEYTAYWTEDAKYTVTYVHGDHGTGDNYVVNNVYGGSYTLVTFATAGFTASSGYAFKKWSVGGVEYAEDASITVSSATTVTAIYKTVDEYTLFTGALVEGDYVICSGTKAMKNETTSAPRIDVADVTVTNNKIVDPDSSIVWHIAQDGDYWTIYNAAVQKYAAFTGTNGRGTLISSVTDYARFSTEDSYEFINVGNSGKYLRYNATYGFASYATSTGVTLTLYKAPSNELSSIALSGDYKTSFASGDTFSFGGTVTASYTIDSPKAVTGSTTFHLDSASGTNMSGVTMTHAAHDGHTIYAKYTEGGITKTATYSISVANAPVSSVSIGTHAAEIGLEEDYSISGITPTVLPADAIQTTEWIVSANTVGNDYTWNGTKLTSGQTEGTVTLRCRSTADNSKYDELVVEISGDPTAAFVKESTSGYAGKSELISFTYGNIDDESKITVASNNTSIVSVANDLVADEGEGLVTINFVAAGSTNVTISYNGGSTLDTLSVTVSADSVVSVTWNASNFDVFSGTTLTSDIDNTWLASYKMASGDEDLISYGEYILKLGGTAITLPHTWVAADDGKNLCIEYGGVSSSTVSVTVTQTINAVYAPNTDTNTVSWTASAAADLGSQISSQGGTDEGTISTGDYSWNYTRTLISLASNKSDYIAFQGETWIQLGSGNAMESIEFTTSAIPGTIKSVTVVAATAGSHELTIDVGGTKYLEDESLHLYSGTAAADNPDPADCVKTGTGSSSGAITITIAPTASTKKAMVIRSISVTYETEGSGTHNIANDASHKAAQRTAVAYAMAFNAAMDETENCTTGLDAAWATCSSAYNSFKSAAAALGSTEEAWAKNLVKYATAQYSDDSGEACIERMMKTYEICVQKHGKTAFMSDLVTLGRPATTPVVAALSTESVNATAIIIVVSVISVTAIGGYFFLRKRREEN